MRRNIFSFSSVGLLAAGLLFVAPSTMRAQNQAVEKAYSNLYRNSNVENDMSKLALKRSDNADVKKFAHDVLSENRTTGGQMMAYSVRDNYRLIGEVPAETKQAEKQMKSLTGVAFDKVYLVQMNAYGKDDQKAAAEAIATGDSEASALGTKVQSMATDRAKQISTLTQADGFQIE